MKHISIIVCLAMLALLTACGGGSTTGSNANNNNGTNSENKPPSKPTPAPSAGVHVSQGAQLALDNGEVLPPSLAESGIKPIVDSNNRQLILNGLNSGYGKHSYMRRFWETPEDLRHEAVNLGFNTFRYLIFWDHIMPTRGVINTDYLDDIEERLGWLHAEGFNVIFDMHQDNWGEQCGGNGAPGWASIGQTDPAPDAPWWIMAASPCVVDSSNAFFNNDDNVQEEFAKAWQAIAERFAGHPAVIGYDLMNEPTQIDAIADQMVHDMLDGATTGLLNFATLWTSWPVWSKEPENGFEGLLKGQIRELAANEGINVPESYVDKISKVLISRNKADWGKLNAVKEFEGTKLTNMYQKVINALREVDADTFIFVEPFSVSVNNGDATFLGKLTDPRGEERRLGYIPHLYPRDLDLSGVYQPHDFLTLQRWYDNQKAFVVNNGMAWLVGEFGLSNHAEGGVTFLDHTVLMMEQAHLGWMNWESWPGDWGPIASDKRSDANNATALINVYPRAVAGEVNHYHFDRELGQFSLIYSKNNATGTTDIAVPPRFAGKGFTVASSNPDGTWSYHFDEARHILHIEHDPHSVKHKFTLSFHNRPALNFTQLVNGHDGKCLDFRGALAQEGAEVITWGCGEKHTWQRWGYDAEQQRIHAMQDTSLCIAHIGEAGTGAWLEACSASDQQKWLWGDDNTLRSATNASLVLDAFGNGQENGNGDGGTVGVWQHHGNLNQQWQVGQY